MPDIMIEMKGIYKNFGRITALRGADFQAYRGEVAAIVGDNGSGKSTLVKLLCGILKPDSGTIRIDQQTFSTLSPARAASCGIAAVYQDLGLDNMRDCASNIFLGRELTKFGFWLDLKAMREQTVALLDRLDIQIQDITEPADALSGGQRQALALARAIHQEQPILVLDEPTAAMGPKESARVLKLIEGLRQRGLTVIMISHNLFQVFEIADRISIMRNGRCLGSVPATASSPAQIYDLITQDGEGVNAYS